MPERNENVWTNLGKAFTDDLRKAVQAVIASKLGKQSDLSDSVEFIPQRDSLYMYVNDYYQAVSQGRKPKKKKIPIMVLIQWIKKNSIQPRKGYSVNQLAYVMQNSIYREGIKGKNFIELVEGSVLDIVEIRVGDNLELLIADSLFASFEVK